MESVPATACAAEDGAGSGGSAGQASSRQLAAASRSCRSLCTSTCSSHSHSPRSTRPPCSSTAASSSCSASKLQPSYTACAPPSTAFNSAVLCASFPLSCPSTPPAQRPSSDGQPARSSFVHSAAFSQSSSSFPDEGGRLPAWPPPPAFLRFWGGCFASFGCSCRRVDGRRRATGCDSRALLRSPSSSGADEKKEREEEEGEEEEEEEEDDEEDEDEREGDSLGANGGGVAEARERSSAALVDRVEGADMALWRWNREWLEVKRSGGRRGWSEGGPARRWW